MKFVSVFGPPISQSVPHIYLSALPFAPKNSLVAKQYLRLYPNSKTLCLKTGKADHWPASISVFEGHTYPVSSVAFSHDSKRIVSGSIDWTIRVWDAETKEGVVLGLLRVWDAETGEPVVGPLKGHTQTVCHVAFSQDSRYIVSGSEDKTIRVWDAETGEVVVGPLKGHTKGVNCVAFSQDSKRIVSGSDDWTIRVWDAETKEGVVLGLLRVWDAETGEPVLGPLKGHFALVISVAFSQDSKRIVSGSLDQTIQIWDAETGEVVVGPLIGHANAVSSVAFSQDNKRIVSGSDDWTIRVWDAETGEVVLGPLKGHTGGVKCIALSQDSKHIVSASWDQTIRVWDAETGEVVIGPLMGHTGCVNSVAFSPDSKRVASGSHDHTIRVWDAEIGEGVVGNHNLTNIFTDTSTLADGWICNSSSNLLFWVPPWNRRGLCWPRNHFVIALGSPSTQLNLDNFVHGNSWQQCHEHL